MVPLQHPSVRHHQMTRPREMIAAITWLAGNMDAPNSEMVKQRVSPPCACRSLCSGIMGWHMLYMPAFFPPVCSNTSLPPIADCGDKEKSLDSLHKDCKHGRDGGSIQTATRQFSYQTVAHVVSWRDLGRPAIPTRLSLASGIHGTLCCPVLPWTWGSGG